jgi:NifU-like protein involved in Fe-S cluster formation
MDYSAEVLARCREPRRAGTLPRDDAAVGTGTAGTLDEGTVTCVQVRVGADGVIADARFKVFGCSAAIASASLVTDRLVGATLDEARRLDVGAVAEPLALAREKWPMAALAVSAARAALDDWDGRHRGERAAVEERRT